VLTFDTGLDEADGIARRIKEDHHRNNRLYRDNAVFLRVNALSRALESAFIQQGIPYQVVKGLAFFDRRENRDVIAYLRLLLNPNDDLSFQRIVNVPPRGIGDVSVKHLKNFAAPREIPMLQASSQVEQIPVIRGKAATGLKNFHALMTTLREYLEASADEVIRQVLDRSGYRAMLAESKDPDDEERLANIEEIITAAKQFVPADGEPTIGAFLEQITLASDVDSWDDENDCVSVMTLHSAKGLEFPVVYMLAVEQGLLPHDRSLAKDEELEEERRLCYVGMTRAKHELYISHARLREFRGQALYAVPSMFLDELPDSQVERIDLCHHSGGYASFDPTRLRMAADEGLAPRPSPSNGGGLGDEFGIGVIVDHAMYGRGKITSLSGEGYMKRVKVTFAHHGEKTFVADKVKLTVVVED
jgi:DNA helicase-2/ATP-dependent DNA helicase PcrA